MITMKEIKADLAEIKYFYGKQELFQKVCDVYGMCAIVKKVERYNALICKAPAKLYELYYHLYVSSNTQEATADIMCYSPNYIWRLNKQLMKFFFDEINKEEKV